MEWLENINSYINDFVWGVPMIVLIVIIGIYFTIRLKFIQFIHPLFLVKETIGEEFKKKESNEKNKITKYDLKNEGDELIWK